MPLLILTGGAIYNEKPIVVDPGPQPDPDPSLPAYFRYGTRLSEGSPSVDVELAMSFLPLGPIRSQYSWTTAVGNTTPNENYNWSRMDTQSSNFYSRGMKILGVIGRVPSWATSVGAAGNYYPDLYKNYFYNFCRNIAARYKTQVEAWEVLNEPNLRGWTAAQVGEILIGASAAIKTGNPDAIVIGGGPLRTFYNTTGSIDRNGWGTFFDNPQVRAAMDAASFHQYQRPYTCDGGDHPNGNLDVIFQNNQDFAAQHNFTKPMWITEAGWPTSTEGISGEVPEDVQARELVKYGVICALFPKISRWHQFQVKGYVTPGIEEGGMGLTRPDGSKKPSWYTLSTLFSIFDEDLLQAQRITQPSNDTWVIKYWRKNRRQGFVYWVATGANKVIQLTGVPSQVRLVSPLGVQSIVSTSDYKINITATRDPQFIELWW